MNTLLLDTMETMENMETGIESMELSTKQEQEQEELESTLSENSLKLLDIFIAAQISDKGTNSKDKDKTEETVPFKSKLSIGTKRHVAAITSYKAREVPNVFVKHRIDRRLHIAKHTEFMTVCCNDTGLVSLLEIPSIPGYALSYYHPLCELSNARGIAQLGQGYLRKLDRQTLSGILIVLAADYSLFVYQPADSGAQKNAILRMVLKDTLINAILTIEDMIHSGNHYYIPKLSLIMDVELYQGAIENRMREWLKLVIEAVYRPDTEIWDENETVQRKLKQLASKDAKERIEKEASIRKEQKALKEDCKLSLCLIKDLFKMELISGKLRIFLAGVFQEFQLITMQAEAKSLLASKLSDINSQDAMKLIEILNKKREGLVAKNTPMEDFFSEVATQPKIKVVSTANETREVTFSSVEIPLVEVPEGMKRISITGKSFIVSIIEYEAMNFLEKVKYHKALLAGLGETK